MFFDEENDINCLCVGAGNQSPVKKSNPSTQRSKPERRGKSEDSKSVKRVEYLYASDGTKICSEESLQFYGLVVELFEATGRSRDKLPVFLKFCSTLAKAKPGCSLEDAISLYCDTEAIVLLTSRPRAPHDDIQLLKMESAFLKQRNELEKFCRLKEEAEEELAFYVERQAHLSRWLASGAAARPSWSIASPPSATDCMALKDLDWEVPPVQEIVEEQLAIARIAAVAYAFPSLQPSDNISNQQGILGEIGNGAGGEVDYDSSSTFFPPHLLYSSNNRSSEYDDSEDIDENVIEAFLRQRLVQGGLGPVAPCTDSTDEAGDSRRKRVRFGGSGMSPVLPAESLETFSHSTSGMWDAFMADQRTYEVTGLEVLSRWGGEEDGMGLQASVTAEFDDSTM
jgi:hypothetical protein